ncbi:hypothetical protein B0T20DRAFT_357007 [Sordaria brevicollis]|uniref:Uncharacterized protein n=1 Tax=Sordaria brevicollis TaxID=83679 RepID=A0AAE0UBH2_SORBR|nr:hypothetical protein B0T20DRAFT_357007 [Sordaria brevicollis]
MAAFGGRLASSLSMRSSLARHGLSTTSASVRPLGLTAQLRLRNPVPSQRRTFVNEAVTTIEQLALAAHNHLHVPWYILIPSLAVTISLTFRVPAAKYTQRLNQRRAQLKPIMAAWGRRHFKEVNIIKQNDPTQIGMDLQAEVLKRMEKTQDRLLKEWKVQQWKMFAPLLAFPGWLIGIEAVRRLCGGPTGLLGMFQDFKTSDGVATSTTQQQADAASQATESVTATATETITNTTDATSQTIADVATTTTTTTPTVDITHNWLSDHLPSSLSSYFQNSLPTTMEGCLWFPDLMAADPTHLLPFILSAVMFVNVMPHNLAGWHRLMNPGTSDNLNANNISEHASRVKAAKSFGVRMQRALLLLTVMVGPLTLNLPAALHMYWITTSLTSNAITSVVAAKMPLPPHVGPAKGRGPEPFVRPKLPGLDWEPDPEILKKKKMRWEARKRSGV